MVVFTLDYLPSRIHVTVQSFYKKINVIRYVYIRYLV